MTMPENKSVESDFIDHTWKKMRSEIYARDKGICWCCHDFTLWEDYDLGHIIDRSHEGKSDYDNLTVMHRKCNHSKPRHDTLEEAMKWRMTPGINNNPKARAIPQSHSYPNDLPINPTMKRTREFDYGYESLSADDKCAIIDLVNEYFKNNPKLLENSAGYNRDRIIASRQLSISLGIHISTIRTILRVSGLVETRPPQTTMGASTDMSMNTY